MGWGYDSQMTEQPAQAQAVYSPAPDSDAIGGVGIATVIDNTGSGGVGTSEEQVQTDAVEFAEACRRAVQNGKTIDEVMAIGASLSEAAKAEIYAQVCVQQGTSPEEIAAKAEAEREAAIAAVQQGVGAILGLSMGSGTQDVSMAQGVTGGENISLAMLGDLVPLQTPGQQREREMGLFA